MFCDKKKVAQVVLCSLLAFFLQMGLNQWTNDDHFDQPKLLIASFSQEENGPMTTLSTKKVAHFFGKSTFEKQTKQQVATRLLGTIVIEFFFSPPSAPWKTVWFAYIILGSTTNSLCVLFELEF